MRHFNSPDELTPQEARDAWYPYLGVDEIDLYEILFSDMSDDYSCVHRVILYAGATEYMEAMALVNISEAIKDGKVNTIVVPYDFKGIVDTRKSK